MHRYRGHPDPSGPCKRVNSSLALGQQVEQLKAFRGREGLADLRVLLEQLGLSGAVRHDMFQYSLEYRNILDLAIGKEQVRAQPQRDDSNVTDTRHVEVTDTTVESLVVVTQAALRELPPGADG